MLQQFAGAQQVEPEPQHPLKSPQQTGASSGQHRKPRGEKMMMYLNEILHQEGTVGDVDLMVTSRTTVNFKEEE